MLKINKIIACGQIVGIKVANKNNETVLTKTMIQFSIYFSCYLLRLDFGKHIEKCFRTLSN